MGGARLAVWAGCGKEQGVGGGRTEVWAGGGVGGTAGQHQARLLTFPYDSLTASQ